jgi:hypothetical protein
MPMRRVAELEAERRHIRDIELRKGGFSRDTAAAGQAALLDPDDASPALEATPDLTTAPPPIPFAAE